MIPCKRCGALSDGGVGLCPDCLNKLHIDGEKMYPGLTAVNDFLFAEGRSDVDYYVRQLISNATPMH